MNVPRLSSALQELNISNVLDSNTSESNKELSNFKTSNISMLGVIDILTYALLIFVFYKALKSEYADLYTNPNHDVPSGKYYVQGKLSDKDIPAPLMSNTPPKEKNKENDSQTRKLSYIKKILDKIDILADTHQNTVKWRRCVILSIFSSVLISILVLNKFPTGKEFLLLVLPIFGTFYASFNYYSYHYDRYPSQFTKENTSAIRELLSHADVR